MMYDLLRSRAAALTQPAIDLLVELIQTPSLSLQEHQVAGVVERTMRVFGFDRVVRDDYGNVLGLMLGHESGPTLLAISHLDTVAADFPDSWQRSPHSGTIDGDRVSGVGAADCKGGLAAQIFAAVALKRSLLPLRGNLVVAATVAEENGAALGVRALISETLPQLGLVPQYAILGEPTDLGVYYGHEGWTTLSILLEGRDAFQVEDAARAVHEGLELSGAGSAPNNGKENFSVMAPRLGSGGPRIHSEIRLTRRLLHGEQVGNVIAVTRECAGLRARAAGSVGVEVDLAQERQRLGTGQTRTVSKLTPAWSTDPFGPLMERSHHALRAAGCTVRPGQWVLDRLGMGTAGGVLVNELRIPTVGYGPGCEKAAHARDESVEIGKVTEAIYGTAAIAHGLVGIPVYGWSSDEI